jgi:hypothetical protein
MLELFLVSQKGDKIVGLILPLKTLSITCSLACCTLEPNPKSWVKFLGPPLFAPQTMKEF